MEIAYKSSKGMVRDKNEDAVGAYENKNGLILALISDGIGGNNAGEVASKMVIDNVGKSFKQTQITSLEEIEPWFESKLVDANAAIIDESKSDKKLAGMGTTLVAALQEKNNGLIVNIGDSRGYLFTKGKLTQITEDHSYVNELVKHGDITPDEAKNNPYKNIITKSLGINDDSSADYHSYTLNFGDQLLLCTDGLTNMVSDEMISKILAENIELTEKCTELVDLANEQGGQDNITVLILLNKPGVNVDE